jgi:NLR family CARD domain-containing protein 3
MFCAQNSILKCNVGLAVEFGLMSTTASRETAVAYSGKDGERCTVLEITAGRVDVGADIGFLSQYPGEKEFLMQPLSCLEVRAHLCVQCPSTPH